MKYSIVTIAIVISLFLVTQFVGLAVNDYWAKFMAGVMFCRDFAIFGRNDNLYYWVLSFEVFIWVFCPGQRDNR